VGRLGSGMRVSAIFQIIPRFVGQLRYGLGLRSGPHIVGRLGSRVWVSASFQIFALTVGENFLGGKGNCPAWEMSGVCLRGGMSSTRINYQQRH